MAQPMTGNASTPIARSNAPISIFAKETTMATKQTAKLAAETVVAPVAEAPVAPKPAKPAKDPAKVAAAVAKLTQTPLERVVARQATRVDNGILRHFANRGRARLTAGQDQDAAVRETFAQYAHLVTDSLAAAAQADADTDSKAAQFATAN